jgi:hypothetical protein
MSVSPSPLWGGIEGGGKDWARFFSFGTPKNYFNLFETYPRHPAFTS